MIQINDKKYETREVVVVEIFGKQYKLPLMKYLKYKQIKKLMALQKDSQNIDAIIEVMEDYIPASVLEELTIDQLGMIMNAWKDTTSEDELKN